MTGTKVKTTRSPTAKSPVVIELEGDSKTKGRTSATQKSFDDTAAVPTPAEVPPVPELVSVLPESSTMHRVAGLMARRPSRLNRFLLWAVTALAGFAVSLAFWDFVSDLLARNALLGQVALGLCALVVVAFLLIILRELAGLSRLRKIDQLRHRAEILQKPGDLGEARQFIEQLKKLYINREDMRWSLKKFNEAEAAQLDRVAIMTLCETNLMQPLDALATKEIELASRQVATATALIPLALVDVLAALTANTRMIRRIAEIYGGRTGSLGSWRLLKTVATHLVATGAVSIGDDLIGSVAGGGILAKVSRRFGEGVINGALTARVGIAAIEVCRPMPFVAMQRPGVTSLVRRALTGLFSFGKSGAD